MTIEERLERLESFIGNIDEISVYANSLQQVIDKYLSPLYIESGDAHTMLIDGYLGDLNNIPRNVVFKIRASHNLSMTETSGDAEIIFKNSSGEKPFTLRKYKDNILVKLEESNYLAGTIYDVYINSQDIAIITSNDAGVTALSELASLSNTITGISTLLSGIVKTDNGYQIAGEITTSKIIADDADINKTLDLTGVSGFTLPSGTTVADPTTALELANQQWVKTYVEGVRDKYHSDYHTVSTEAASVALADKPDGAFYYKISK